MMENPYPEEIEDETSGIMVPDLRHITWEQGYKACQERIIERIGRGKILAVHPHFFDELPGEEVSIEDMDRIARQIQALEAKLRDLLAKAGMRVEE